MKERVGYIDQALIEMPAAPKELLAQSYNVRKEIEKVSLQLNGDPSKVRREFETTPSIADRIFTIQYSLWNSTAKVPTLFVESYKLAEKQMPEVISAMKKIKSDLENLEKELEKNNAPYTPGRWPE
jgi:hypothetical protein